MWCKAPWRAVLWNRFLPITSKWDTMITRMGCTLSDPALAVLKLRHYGSIFNQVLFQTHGVRLEFIPPCLCSFRYIRYWISISESEINLPQVNPHQLSTTGNKTALVEEVKQLPSTYESGLDGFSAAAKFVDSYLLCRSVFQLQGRSKIILLTRVWKWLERIEREWYFRIEKRKGLSLDVGDSKRSWPSLLVAEIKWFDVDVPRQTSFRLRDYPGYPEGRAAMLHCSWQAIAIQNPPFYHPRSEKAAFSPRFISMMVWM